MAERKSFLVRIDPDILDAVRAWADDDLRSVNGQIEFLLRRALKEEGRLPKAKEGRAAKTSSKSKTSRKENRKPDDRKR